MLRGETLLATILFVDVSPRLLRLATLVLETAGHHVLVSDTSEQAVELASKHRPDIAVVHDWIEEREAGPALLARFGSEPGLAEMPVVLTYEGRRPHPDGWSPALMLKRPYDWDELLSHIEGLLADERS